MFKANREYQTPEQRQKSENFAVKAFLVLNVLKLIFLNNVTIRY